MQIENRPQVQISDSEIRTQISVLSSPALTSSLQAQKGVMPGKNGSQASILQRQSWNFHKLTLKKKNK